MVYNGHATNLDCVSEVLKICGATTATYPLVDITRRFNFALDRYFELAFKSDGRWSYDDVNQTSPPIDTQNLVSGTNRYKIASFTEKVHKLLRLDILDSSANPLTLTEESLDDLEEAFAEVYSTSDTGVPTHYLILGDYIYLRPCPNYSEASGLVAYFNRPALYMASTDTTKIPGTTSIHHGFLCRFAALPFLIEKNLPQMVGVAQQIQRDEAEIGAYFASRNKGEKKGLAPVTEDNR